MRMLPSLMLICCLLWGTIEAVPHGLSCPPLDDDVGGICSEECPSDGDCPNGQLCCSNGCGHSCVDPIRIPYHTPPADSMCPPIDDDVAGTCDERCTNNSDCGVGEMCCSNGCGHVCMAPMSTCKAVQFMVSNQSLIGSYLPQCEEDGSFSRVQCHGSTGYCWCVEPEGGQPVSEVVRFQQPQCSQDLFYSCPAVRADTAGICEHECSLDSECTDSKKCCYNGCGHTCQPPVTIPYISLSEDTSCPSTNEVPCVDQEGGGSCRDPAFSCDEGEICCDNECSSAVCLSLNDLKPCLTAKSMLGNSSHPLLGAYRPQCDEDGLFRDLQCHEHYCWCVETSTGRPTSDMVPFENSDDLQCSVCVYNGRKYQLHDHFPSSDGCNQCTCFRGGVSCTEMACLPINPNDQRGSDGDHLWEWWHTVLIACIAVVIILAVVVAMLTVGVFVVMKQNGQYRHHKMKEVIPQKYEPEEVQFKTGQDSIELKVPVEDVDEHKPAHA